MNITDVDDKIIIKARHAYLLQQYEQQNPIVTAHVVAEIREALEKEVASCGKKRTETLADMEKSEAERVGEARLLEQRALAASQFLGSLNESAVGQPSAALIRSASDALAVALDAKFKETVKVHYGLAVFCFSTHPFCCRTSMFAPLLRATRRSSSMTWLRWACACLTCSRA